MEKFKLNNGATIVIAECSSKELSVSVTVNVGHVNEPKLGIAALYENVLMKQVSRVQTVYGGTVTSFFTGCEKEELEMTMSKRRWAFFFAIDRFLLLHIRQKALY